MPRLFRSWGYAAKRPLTPTQEKLLNQRLDRYHAVQHHNFVDELEVTEAVLGRPVPFSELTVEEANRVAAHLNVRIALYTYFRAEIPNPPADFRHELDPVLANRRLLDRVIARAGWDTAEYFLSPHPLDQDR